MVKVEQQRLQKEDILKLYTKGYTKPEDFKIGMEYERLPISATSYKAVDYWSEYGIKNFLEEFAKDGNINAFIRSLQHVVKARGRGAISALAKELDIDRSNLSDILNGKVQPKISTTLKLINGLGYKIQLKSA